MIFKKINRLAYACPVMGKLVVNMPAGYLYISSINELKSQIKNGKTARMTIKIKGYTFLKIFLSFSLNDKPSSFNHKKIK